MRTTSRWPSSWPGCSSASVSCWGTRSSETRTFHAAAWRAFGLRRAGGRVLETTTSRDRALPRTAVRMGYERSEELRLLRLRVASPDGQRGADQADDRPQALPEPSRRAGVRRMEVRIHRVFRQPETLRDRERPVGVLPRADE